MKSGKKKLTGSGVSTRFLFPSLVAALSSKIREFHSNDEKQKVLQDNIACP